eukprot:535975_1
MFPSQSVHRSSCIYLFSRTCIGLNYHSRYHNCNRRVKRRKDKKKYLRGKIEDPVTSADMAFLDPTIRVWKHWKWSYNKFSSQQYQKLKKEHDRKQRMYAKEDELPYWYNKDNSKLINVIFIRDMDEFLAGEVVQIETGLYRGWLWPQKIAVPASQENIERWKHLNMEQRIERDRKVKMEEISNDISQVRLEMKLRRDPETDNIYTRITKQRICRKLLLLKRITVKPEQIIITRLATSILTSIKDENIGDIDVITESGSYIIKLALDDAYDYQFEFRLNVRHNDIEKDNKTPFSLIDDDDDDDMDEDEVKRQKMKKKELRTNLKKWKRGKQAHQMLDSIVDRSSRYSHLYNVSKLDLTQNREAKSIEST